MKPNLASLLALLFLGVTTQAALIVQPFSSGFANSGNIPDGDTTGWSDARTLNGIAEISIADISVRLNLTGGFNGDLYAYLSHDGVLVPLLNRVGVTATSPASDFGYLDAGFSVTLNASAANDVHFYDQFSPTITGGQLTGTWQPDGRTISPLLAAASFDSASRVSLDAFNGHDPNGSWTLFIADVSAGGGQSQLTSWELDITAVPEPGEWTLVMGLVSLGAWVGRKRFLS
jgi:subtilisin-like proprotein convertase family protein